MKKLVFLLLGLLGSVPFMLAQQLDWVRSLDNGIENRAISQAVNLDGSVVTIGHFGGTLDLDPGAGLFNVTNLGAGATYIQQLDANGLFVWGSAISPVSNNLLPNSRGAAVAVDTAGNVYVVGLFKGEVDFDPGPGTAIVVGGNASDIFVAKYSSSGTFVWIRTLGDPAAFESVTDIDIDPNGDLLIAGQFESKVDFDPNGGVQNAEPVGFRDVFLLKLTKNGFFQWVEHVGPVVSQGDAFVEVEPNGEIFLLATYTGGINSAGTIDLDPGPGVDMFTGFGGAMVIHLDEQGDYKWGRVIESGTSFTTTTDIESFNGSCYLTTATRGTTDLDPSAGNTVIATVTGFFSSYVVKLDSLGNYQWGRLLDAFDVRTSSLAVNDCELLVTGFFGGLNSPGGSELELDTAGLSLSTASNFADPDIFVASYAHDGMFHWGFALNNAASDNRSNAISVTDEGKIHLAGDFTNTLDFDPTGGAVIPGSSARSSFMATYSSVDCSKVCEDVRIAPKLFVSGAYDANEQMMYDSLRLKGLIPSSEPYSALGHIVDYADQISPIMLNVPGPNAMVDWVLVQLRDKADSTLVIESRAAILQRDGDVVSAETMGAVSFCIPSDEYFVAVLHRNHLGVMSSTALPLGSTTTTLDFSSQSPPAYGTEPMKQLVGGFGLWEGDVSGDGLIKYVGINNDRDIVLTDIGGSVPTSVVQGYLSSDVNLDGVVKYVGVSNDRDLILVNIGGSVPTNTRIEQLP